MTNILENRWYYNAAEDPLNNDPEWALYDSDDTNFIES